MGENTTSKKKGIDSKPRNRLKKVIQTIMAAVGFLSALIAIWVFFFSSEPVLVNTEIVIDTSRKMADKIDGSSKLQLVQTVISKVLNNFSNRDNLALRRYGGDCDNEDATRLVVSFGQKNKETIVKKLQAFNPEGKANMVQALREAVADFNPILRFPGTKKTLVMVIGSCDDCVDDPIEKIHQRIKDTNINLDWKFVGLDLDKDCKKQFAMLSRTSNLMAAKNVEQFSMAMDDAFSGKVFRNLPPEINLGITGNKVSVQAEKQLSIIVSASDPNMVQPLLSASSLPKGAGFKPKTDGTYEFNWIPRSDQTGEYSIDFKAFDGTLEASTKLYISVLPSKVIEQVSPPKVNSITLNYPGFVLFDLESSIISTLADSYLKRLVADLKTARSINKIKITGRTCSKGTFSYNKKLGLLRAEAVRDYLILSGISGDLQTVSMGEENPANDNITLSGRKKNRCVDIDVKMIRN